MRKPSWLGRLLTATMLLPALAGAQTVSLTTQGRQVSILVGADAVLPADFPGDVPLLPDAQLVSAQQQEGSDTLLLEFAASPPVDAVATHYTDAMAAAGWTRARVQAITGGRVLAWEKAQRAALLALEPDGAGRTRVRLQLLPRRAAASTP